MTRQSKSLLKSLITFSEFEENTISFLSDTTYFCFYDDTSKTMDYSKFSKEICGLIQYLADNGYLAYSFENNPYHFHLTYKGLHFRKFHWLEIRNFILCSILTPIAVSLATTLLTLWLKGLLPLP